MVAGEAFLEVVWELMAQHTMIVSSSLDLPVWMRASLARSVGVGSLRESLRVSVEGKFRAWLSKTWWGWS